MAWDLRWIEPVACAATRGSMASDNKVTSDGSDAVRNVRGSSTFGTADVQGEPRRERNPVKRFLKILGPGFITGASDDDPSGIGTYAMAGALLGHASLWMALVTFPLMAGVQFTCAKLGMVTG